MNTYKVLFIAAAIIVALLSPSLFYLVGNLSYHFAVLVTGSEKFAALSAVLSSGFFFIGTVVFSIIHLTEDTSFNRSLAEWWETFGEKQI